MPSISFGSIVFFIIVIFNLVMVGIMFGLLTSSITSIVKIMSNVELMIIKLGTSLPCVKTKLPEEELPTDDTKTF